MSTFYLESYGCSANRADAELIAGALSRAGWQSVRQPGHADLLIINTCIVKSQTERRMCRRIAALTSMRKPLIIAGCMPESHQSLLAELAPSASLLSTHYVDKVITAAKSTLQGKRVQLTGHRLAQRLCQPRIRTNPLIGIVPISVGCLANCSYCCVRAVKGELRSYKTEQIVQEVALAKRTGCREFWLTGQDCACWGADTGSNLAELLQTITTQVSGKYFIRIGMLNPAHLKHFLPEFIRACTDSHIFKFFHIPVQSGSDRILDAMARGYTVADFKAIVTGLRAAFPRAQLWTDLIIGFPGETEEDFQATTKLINEIKPDFVNVSKYGSRPGTPAARMSQLRGRTIAQRSRAISELVDKISVEKNSSWLGWTGDVLIDEWSHTKANWTGRNFAYKPIILQGNYRIGEIVKIKIVKAERVLFGQKI